MILAQRDQLEICSERVELLDSEKMELKAKYKEQQDKMTKLLDASQESRSNLI